MLVDDAFGEKLQVGLPIAQDADGRGAGAGVLRTEEFLEEVGLAVFKRLVHPEGLQAVMLRLGVGRVERLRPRAEEGEDFPGVPLGHRSACHVAIVIERRLEEVEERGHGRARYARGLEEGAALRRDLPDPSMTVAAARIAEVVGHLADDEVVEVEDVDRAVGAHGDVHGAEAVLLRLEDGRLDFGHREPAPVVLDPVEGD